MPQTNQQHPVIERPQLEGLDTPLASIETAARALAAANSARTIDGLDEPKQAIADLVAGLNPRERNIDDPNFRFGASEALSTVLNAVTEQMVSISTERLLYKANRARILNGVARWPGVSQRQLAENLDIKAPNLSSYLQELADVSLIEPAAASQRGKAWALSPWGVQTFLQLAPQGFSGAVPEDELTQGLTAAGQSYRTNLVQSRELIGIPKAEAYSRVEAALDLASEDPLRLTTFYSGNLREHPRPWALHEKVFCRAAARRPVEWIVLCDDKSHLWANELIEHGKSNEALKMYRLDRLEEPGPTVQVLDDVGVLYPLPGDTGAVQNRDSALGAWTERLQDAELVRR